MGNQCTAKKKYIYCSFSDLNDEDMHQISQQVLKQYLNSQELQLKLSINKFGNPGLISLGEAVSQCVNLKELNLDLGANKYDQNGVKLFCEYLIKCKNLTSLTLSFRF
ncbi:hypothetical protein ABPG72_018105 [Tetrahymena utriculariae]